MLDINVLVMVIAITASLLCLSHCNKKLGFATWTKIV